MKISVASLALAMLAEVAIARNCKAGLDYCGPTLLAIGTMNHVSYGLPTDTI
jgi:hypothetical protein